MIIKKKYEDKKYIKVISIVKYEKDNKKNIKYLKIYENKKIIKYNTLEDYVRFIQKNNKKNYILYIYDLNTYKKNILYTIEKIGYKYLNSKNLKTYSYNGYIDSNNKIYFLNLRYRNKYIKIIDLFNILNYENIKNITDEEIVKNLKYIIKKYGIQNTMGKYSEYIFFNNLVKKYNKEVCYIYPNLNNSIYNFCNNSVFGGINIINPKYKNKKIKSINVYDVNSLYPYIMKTSKLPYGKPIYYKGEYKTNDKYNIYIQHIKVDFKLKKIPFLNLNKNYNIENNIITSSNGFLIDLYLTNVDLKNFLKNYEINELYYIDGLKFKSTNKIFIDFVDKFYKLKNKYKNNLVLKKFFKNILNMIYGKFGVKNKVAKKMTVLESEKIKFKRLENIKTNTLYIPVACFIGAYSRDYMLKKIEENQNNFVYTDTDSLHIFEKKIKTGNKIGMMKCEMEKAEGKYLQNKLYYLRNNEIEKKVICGAPSEAQEKINFKNFKKNKKVKYNKIEYDEKLKKIIKQYTFTI